MMREFGFVYDSSIATPVSNPPLWPYTLDYQIPHKCIEHVYQLSCSVMDTPTVKIVVTRVGVIPHMILTLLLLVTIQTARYLTASVPQMELLFLVECCQQMFLR